MMAMILPLLKNKLVWIGVLVVAMAGYGYWQTTNYIEQKFITEQLEQDIKDANAARVKLLEDIERMNTINKTLEEDKRDAQARINRLATSLANAVGQINSASTPEETAAVSIQIRDMTDRSYECIEAMTGKVGAQCEQ